MGITCPPVAYFVAQAKGLTQNTPGPAAEHINSPVS